MRQDVGEGFAAEVADGGYVGIGGRDVRVCDSERVGGLFDAGERDLDVGVGSFGAEEAEDLFAGLE